MYKLRSVFWFLTNYMAPGTTSLRPMLRSLRWECWQLAYGVWMKTKRDVVTSMLGIGPGQGQCSTSGSHCSCFCNLSFSSDSLTERKVSKARHSTYSLPASGAPHPSPNILSAGIRGLSPISKQVSKVQKELAWDLEGRSSQAYSGQEILCDLFLHALIHKVHTAHELCPSRYE